MIHECTSARALALARIWVFGMCLGDVVREPIHDVLGLPLEFYTRVGPLALLPDGWLEWVYTDGFLSAFKGTLAAALALCVLGPRPFPLVAVPTCLLLIFHHAVVRSIGHINHGELAMLYAALILSLSPVTDAWSLGRRRALARPRSHYAAPMLLMALVFCLSYAFVGAYRIAMSGPEIFFNGSIVRLVIHAGARPGRYDAAFGTDLLTSAVVRGLLEVGFVGVTLMEVLAPLALFSAIFRRLWIVVIVSFHLITFATMQLLFIHNLVLIPLLMLDWTRILERFPASDRAAARAG